MLGYFGLLILAIVLMVWVSQFRERKRHEADAREMRRYLDDCDL